MAHELTITDGKAEMAYTGELPWHGLGQELQEGASIEEWIAAAGLTWTIKRAKVRYAVSKDSAADSTTWREFDDRVVLLRSDNHDGLGIVSLRYQVVQPRESVEFFRDLTESVGFTLSTAGSLNGGRRIWTLAKTNAEAIVLDKRDRVKANLLLATSCDGSGATEASYVATRVVCANTLRMANSENGRLVVKVNHKSKFDAKAVKAELGIESAMSAFESTVARMRAMGETRMSEEAIVLATCGLLNPGYADLDAKGKDKFLRSKPVDTICRLVLDKGAIGSDMEGMGATAYGWLNAVTEYVDHHARAQSVDNRLESAWFGKGADLKAGAFEMAGAVADYAPSGHGAVDSVNDWLTRHA